MFKKILIANRGEIALRVICACKELGIQTVAVYSEADEHSACTCASPTRPSASARRRARRQLPEHPVHHQRRRDHQRRRHPPRLRLPQRERRLRRGLRGLPTSSSSARRPEVIRLMGDKERARRASCRRPACRSCRAASGVLEAAEEALRVANEIGFPVIIKATAGGGGRGMRIVREASELALRLRAGAAAKRRRHSASPTSTSRSIIERPRHIEFQVLADHHGNVDAPG